MAIVVQTVRTYALDGSTKDFIVPFEYLARKFVQVSLLGTAGRKQLVLNSEFRFSTKNQVTLLQAWGPANGYDRVEIRRHTSSTERLVDFTDGSILRATDLNISQIQAIHIAEEARDAALLALPQDDDGNLDAKNRRIVNLATGINAQDAVNKQQLDETLGEAGGVLSEVKDLQKDIEDYLQSWGDDTTAIRGVLWVYNQGSAVGGETSFVITKEGPVLAVPYIEINGSRQYRGWHYEYDLGSKTVTLAKPLVAGDLVVCTTAETTLPLADSLAGPTGASQIGMISGLSVEDALANAKMGVNVLDFMTPSERAAALNYSGENDNSEAFRKAFATGVRQVIVPPGKYHVKDVVVPTRVKLIGSWSYRPYNATSDNSFGTDGTLIRKAQGGSTMFLWNGGCGADGVLFDGRDRTASAIQSQSGGKITVMFYRCGFYRFARVGNRNGAYIATSFQFCNFNQNNIGIYNTVDGNHIGCTINANKLDGVRLETGADSNTFTNCRNEWNEGHNWNFYGCTSIQVVNEICDRAFGFGFRISNSSVALINVNIRRSARTAAGADSAHIYLENSNLRMIGVRSSTGVDDTGGAITTPSPNYMFRMFGPNKGRLEITDSNLTGFTTGLISGTARPEVLRIVNCQGWENTVNEGVLRYSKGKAYFGPAPSVTGSGSITLPFSGRGVATNDEDIMDVQLSLRGTSTGGHTGCVVHLLISRETGAASGVILGITSRGEFGVLDSSDPAATQQSYQIVLSDISHDGSTFNLTVKPKSTAQFRVKGYLKQ